MDKLARFWRWFRRQWRERRKLTVLGTVLALLGTCFGCSLLSLGGINATLGDPTPTPHPPTSTPTPTPRPTATSPPRVTATPSPTAPTTPTDTPSPTPTITTTPTPTQIPPTQAPATQAPATQAPATQAPATQAPVPAREYIADGVWRCPGDITGATYVGSIDSDKFHWPNCRWAGKILPENRICFSSREAAINYGYQACGTCSP